MADMRRKVSFYKLSFVEYVNLKGNSSKVVEIPDEKNAELFRQIINNNNFRILKNGNKATNVFVESAHYVIEIVDYSDKNDKVYLRIGSQNSPDTVALRNINTLESDNVRMNKYQLLELFTYCLIDLKTGILSYLGIDGAPRISAVKNMFNYNLPCKNIEANIAAIMTDDILEMMKKKKFISKITLTVAVPSDKILSDYFGLKLKAFDALKNVKTQKVTISIVGNRNKGFFGEETSLESFVEKIKQQYKGCIKEIKANAKNEEHDRTQTYDLLHYCFTRTVTFDKTENSILDEKQFKEKLNNTYEMSKEELLKNLK